MPQLESQQDRWLVLALVIVASVTVHLAYYALMISAYRVGDLSLVYPLMRGAAPLVTAVLAIAWMGEQPSAANWTGMLLISLGVIALALRGAGHQPRGSAIGFALLNAVVIAAYTVIDAAGARLAGNVLSYVAWLFVLDALMFGAYLLATAGGTAARALWLRRRTAALGGGASAGAYAIALWAMTQAPVALVASLRETSVLFAALIGSHLLRERLSPRRWAGVAAIIAGVLALKLA